MLFNVDRGVYTQNPELYDNLIKQALGELASVNSNLIQLLTVIDLDTQDQYTDRLVLYVRYRIILGTRVSKVHVANTFTNLSSKTEILETLKNVVNKDQKFESIQSSINNLEDMEIHEVVRNNVKASSAIESTPPQFTSMYIGFDNVFVPPQHTLVSKLGNKLTIDPSMIYAQDFRTNGMTYSMWIYFDSTSPQVSSDVPLLFSKPYGPYIRASTSSYFVLRYPEYDQLDIFIPVNNWIHIARTSGAYQGDSTEQRFYVNGIEMQNDNTWKSLWDSNIDDNLQLPLQFFDDNVVCKLKDVAIWERDLSNVEISYLYNEGKGFYDKVVDFQDAKHYWTFDNTFENEGVIPMTWQSNLSNYEFEVIEMVSNHTVPLTVPVNNMVADSSFVNTDGSVSVHNPYIFVPIVDEDENEKIIVNRTKYYFAEADSSPTYNGILPEIFKGFYRGLTDELHDIQLVIDKPTMVAFSLMKTYYTGSDYYKVNRKLGFDENIANLLTLEGVELIGTDQSGTLGKFVSRNSVSGPDLWIDRQDRVFYWTFVQFNNPGTYTWINSVSPKHQTEMVIAVVKSLPSTIELA